MKKIFFPFTFSVLIAIVMTSCEKEPKQITENFNVTLKKNQAYHYTLPSRGESDDPFKITTQASHYQVSRLESDKMVYAYTPGTDYTGEDRVVIENAEDSRCGHGSCCEDGEKTERTIIIRFTIQDETLKPVVTNQVFHGTICPSF